LNLTADKGFKVEGWRQNLLSIPNRLGDGKEASELRRLRIDPAPHLGEEHPLDLSLVMESPPPAP